MRCFVAISVSALVLGGSQPAVGQWVAFVDETAQRLNEGGVLVDRTLESAPGFIDTPTDARDVVVADFTRDGWLGLVDESEARFPTISVAQMPGPKFCAVAGGDVTGNGALDIYFSNYNPSVGTGATREGSYGADSEGFQRLQDRPGCRVQTIASCP